MRATLGELWMVGLYRVCAAISTKDDGVWDISGVVEREKIWSADEHR